MWKSRKEDELLNINLINLSYYCIKYSVRIEDDSIPDGEVCNTGSFRPIFVRYCPFIL